MLKWLRRLTGGGLSPAEIERLEEAAGPQPGQHWVYVTATGCDVEPAVRAIDGVLKVTRASGERWRIVADRDVAGAVAREIVSKHDGKLTLLITPESLAALRH